MWEIVKKLFVILGEIGTYDKSNGKPIWKSKTLWVNAIALTALLSSKYININISNEDQLAILTSINVILRLISKDETGLIERK